MCVCVYFSKHWGTSQVQLMSLWSNWWKKQVLAGETQNWLTFLAGSSCCQDLVFPRLKALSWRLSACHLMHFWMGRKNDNSFSSLLSQKGGSQTDSSLGRKLFYRKSHLVLHLTVFLLFHLVSVLLFPLLQHCAIIL